VNISNIVNKHLITEEEHAVMGALRMHALDFQTNAHLANNPAHVNPEEIIYVLRGNRRSFIRRNTVQGQSRIISICPEGETHGIYNTNSMYPLHYFVLEFIEHDRALTEKSLQQ
jgi:hypothetical protein